MCATDADMDDDSDDEDDLIFRRKTFITVGFDEQQAKELSAYIQANGGTFIDSNIYVMLE